MDWHQVMAFWGVSMLLVVTPGADWAYCISAGIKGRVVLRAVSGLLLGYVLLTLLVAAGVAALFASIPIAMRTLTYLGAGYLGWLGVGLLRDPPVPCTDDEAHPQSRWTWVYRGFCTSGLNPKALLLFLALLPQFTQAGTSWPTSFQIAALGLVQIVNCALIYSLVGVCSTAVLRASPRTAAVIGRLSGIVMIALAVMLMGGHLTH
jgi:threonine/homoserine/homoserine lactone efflux protein